MKKLFVQCLLLAATAFVGNAIEPSSFSAVKTAGSPVVMMDTDYDYSEWKSLGEATVEGVNVNMDAYAEFFGVEFVLTTEVYIRQSPDDEYVTQYLFKKFLGHNDFVIDVALNYEITSQYQASGIIPDEETATQYGFDEYYYGAYGLYSPFTNTFLLNNFGLAFGAQNYGYWFSLRVILSGDVEITFSLGAACAGGMKSTDTYIEYPLTLTGVDHIKYVAYKDGDTTLSQVEIIKQIITGEIASTTTTDKVRVNFNAGAGCYNVPLLAFDETDSYIGVQGTWSVTSNLAPEGTWADVGTGVWHHPYGTTVNPYVGEYSYLSEDYEMSATSWDVQIQKRTDVANREIYRVVNPYGESFVSVQEPVELEEGELYPYDKEDDYWFVFEVTDPDAVTCEYRKSGSSASCAFYYFRSKSDGVYHDGLVTFADYHYYGIDLVIEMPGYRGQGIVDAAFDWETGNVISVEVGENVREVRAGWVLGCTDKPAQDAIDEYAVKICAGTGVFISKTTTGSEIVSLDIPEGLTRPCVAIIVALDENREPFTATAVDIFSVETIEGATMSDGVFRKIFNENSVLDPVETSVAVTLGKSIDGSEVLVVEKPWREDNYHMQILVYNDWTMDYCADNSEPFIFKSEDGITYTNDTPKSNICILSDAYECGVYVATGTREGNVITFAPTYAVLNGEYYECACPLVLTLPTTQESIDEVEAVDENGAVEYYNLQGVKVQNPGSGIYIRRQGTSVKTVKL